MDVDNITAVLVQNDSTSLMLVPGMKYLFRTHFYFFQPGQKSM